jgi:hypothetical protein
MWIWTLPPATEERRKELVSFQLWMMERFLCLTRAGGCEVVVELDWARTEDERTEKMARIWGSLSWRTRVCL